MAQLSPYALRLALYLVLMLLFGRMLFVRPGLPRGVSLALALIAVAVHRAFPRMAGAVL